MDTLSLIIMGHICYHRYYWSILKSLFLLSSTEIVSFSSGVRADSKRIECPNEQIVLDCPYLESVIQNGTFLDLLWRVTDPEDLKTENIGYCNKDLKCTRYQNIGSFDRRIDLSHPVRGALLVKQKVLNDRLSYTCAIERSGNKGLIAHKITVTSSMHCK